MVDIFFLQKKDVFDRMKQVMVSPVRRFMRREFTYFIVTGVMALFILHIVSFYFSGVRLVEKTHISANALSDEMQKVKGLLSQFDTEKIQVEIVNIQRIIGSLKEDFQEYSLNNGVALGEHSILHAVHRIFSASEHILESGKVMMEWGSYFQSIPRQILSSDSEHTFRTSQLREKEQQYMSKILASFDHALNDLRTIQTDILSESVASVVTSLQTRVFKLRMSIEEFQQYLGFLYAFLGDPHPQRYLILLQNENEIRATGGFLGSYILLTFNDGVMDYSFHDIYEHDNQYASTILAPPGLNEVIQHWYLRDANYYPDFPLSAEKIMWFLDEEGGPTVNGVIALDLAFIEKFVSLIDPIYLSEYDVTLTPDNFSFILSYIVEAKLGDNRNPKKVIDTIIPAFQEGIKKQFSSEVFLALIKDSLDEKHLSLYFENKILQRSLELLGYGHTMAQPDQDYFQIVHTSIGGNKSDAFLQQKIVHRTDIQFDQEIVNKVYIERTHTWGANDETLFESLYQNFGSGKTEKDRLRDIMGYGANRSFVRIYVPFGSDLMQVEGIDRKDVEMATEHGKTVFRFVSPRIYPGETNRVAFTYRLPRRLDFNGTRGIYSLLWQKQMGSKHTSFVKKIYVPNETMFTIEDTYPTFQIDTATNHAWFQGNLTTDKEFELVVKKVHNESS